MADSAGTEKRVGPFGGEYYVGMAVRDNGEIIKAEGGTSAEAQSRALSEAQERDTKDKQKEKEKEKN